MASHFDKGVRPILKDARVLTTLTLPILENIPEVNTIDRIVFEIMTDTSCYAEKTVKKYIDSWR